MNFYKHNTGTLLAFKSVQAHDNPGVRKKSKNLLDLAHLHIFSHSWRWIVAKVIYLRTPKKQILEPNLTISDKFEMKDILVEVGKLSHFPTNLDITIYQELLNETEKRQKEVLKRKGVDEERLRKVVQL